MFNFYVVLIFTQYFIALLLEYESRGIFYYKEGDEIVREYSLSNILKYFWWEL